MSTYGEQRDLGAAMLCAQATSRWKVHRVPRCTGFILHRL